MTAGRREPPSQPPSQRPVDEERAGPLIVERHRKADGRALSLYWEAPSKSGTAGERETRGARGTPDKSETSSDG